MSSKYNNFLLTWLTIPFKFYQLKKIFPRRAKIKVLDVGCGNGSPSATKAFFPECHYSGLDRARYNNTDIDLQSIDHFYEIDLSDAAALKRVPDENFDVIICSHVIEHVAVGLAVVTALASKLRPGGIIFLEYPSVRSIALPSLKGTLRFADDDTHCQLYTLESVCNALMDSGCIVVSGGRRRFLRRILLMPLVILKNWHAPAGAFWDLLGFSDYVLARRKDN